MATHSFEMEFTKEELGEFVESIVGDDFEQALKKIALHFIPRRADIEAQVRKLAKDYAFSFSITKQLLDHEGRPVASVGSIDEDFDGNVVHHVSQTMSYAAIFLREILNAFVDRFQVSTHQLVDYMYASPTFEEDKQEFLRKGIEAYLLGDNLTSPHLLIPQVEVCIRKLAELLGVSVLKMGRNGAMQYKLLDELLRESRMEVALGTDASLYFRILFTDQRGWNLRNGVMHGLIPQQQFDQGMADRVIHALLCLALIRGKQE